MATTLDQDHGSVRPGGSQCPPVQGDELVVDFPSSIKEGDAGDGVSLGGAGREERRDHPAIRLSIGRVLEVERLVEHGRPGRSVEMIQHEHRVSLTGEPPAEIAERRTEAERIGPDQDAGMGAGRRMNEDRVAGAVGSPDLDVGLDDRSFAGPRWRCQGSQSRRQRQRDKVTTCRVVERLSRSVVFQKQVLPKGPR